MSELNPHSLPRQSLEDEQKDGDTKKDVSSSSSILTR